jgi:hypothetical protein
LIAAGQDHRIGARPPTTGNTGNAGPVHPGPGERLARGEVTARRIAWNRAKPGFGHGHVPIITAGLFTRFTRSP